LLARLTDTEINVSPSLLGKATTVFQLVYIILVLVFFSYQFDLASLTPLLYAMIILTVVSGFHYILRSVNTISFPGGGDV